MAWKTRIVLLLVVSLVVQSAGSKPSLAFMTYARFGGTIHRAILSDALSPLGVQETNLAVIGKGADSQDALFTKKFTGSPQNHCDDNKIQEGYKYWTARLQKAVADAQDADKSPKKRDRSLFEFGEAMHTVQDFYSHANYVEWLLENKKPVEVLNWNDLPAQIRTGYYYYGGPLSNDSFCKRPKSIRNLLKKHPDLKFRSEEEYESRIKSDSYPEALDFVLKPGDLLHRELNKDNGETMEGKIVVPEQSKTLYDLARQLATADTARQWKNFEQMIREKYGDKSTLIINALKGENMKAGVETIQNK